MRVQPRLREMLQSMHDHLRPEIRAADTDVHHMADPLAGVTGPRAVAHLVRERGHLGFFGADFLLKGRVVSGGTQGRMQYRAMLRHVDDIAGEHRRRACRPLLPAARVPRAA